MTERLFVYGSLQPGGSNHSVLEPYRGSWEPAWVVGFLWEKGWGADQGYPGLVLDDKGESVSGYVFTSNDLSANWEALDEFEGIEYERCLAPVMLDSGETVMAHIYTLSDAPKER